MLRTVEDAGLRGRGGAGFPTARKLAAVRGRRGPRVVVANCSEGEPPSAKDRTLLAWVPHLVLDGAAVAAATVGADRILVAAHHHSLSALEHAISERGGGPFEVVEVPDRFIAGQETALVDFLSGGPGLPTLVPPRPTDRGVDGRPTLVSNAETLAHVALLARHGAAWYRQVGTHAEPGSTLVTVHGGVARPGVYEVQRGAPLADLLDDAGGTPGGLSAVLTGGFAGGWVAAHHLAGAALSDASLASLGSTFGAGVVIALPAGDCGVSLTAHLMRYLAGETAGQCGPCVNGLDALAGGLEQLADGTARRDVIDRLTAWAWQVEGRGACKHPDGAARLVRSALAAFASDVAAHAAHRPCAGAARPSAALAEIVELGRRPHGGAPLQVGRKLAGIRA